MFSGLDSRSARHTVAVILDHNLDILGQVRCDKSLSGSVEA